MITLQHLNLNLNPFKDITANASVENPHWAGMQEVKEKIERTYDDCITNSSKQLVLNWGAYGGGKTFSAYYFQRIISAQHNNVTHIYLQLPKDGGKVNDDVFRSIVNSLTIEKISSQIRLILSATNQDTLLQFLRPIAGDEFSKAILLLASGSEEVRSIMSRYLYEGVTKAELKKINIATNIQTDTDSIKFLSGIISCFIGNGTFFDGRVVFWFDEMEDLIYYAPKHHKIFSQIIRELFNSVPSSFLLFMNFTLAEGEEKTIEIILGAAVWSRITKKIRYKQFELADAIEYTNSQLDYARINKNTSRPFSDAVVGRIIEAISIPQLTPREINKRFNSLISYLMINDITDCSESNISIWEREYEEDN